MTHPIFKSKNYQDLSNSLKQLNQKYRLMNQKLDQRQMVDDYWQNGLYLCQLQEQLPIAQKTKILNQLAKDSKISKRFLYHLQQFFLTFSNGIPRIKHQDRLKWSHFLKVLPIEDKQERLYYLRQAAREDLTIRDLDGNIHQDLYGIIKRASEEYPNGLIERNYGPRFVYVAYLVKVIDGDTLVVSADMGFHTRQDLTVRLRGIDTPEMKGPKQQEAQAAMAFTYETLKNLEFFIIKTYKGDSFGRYIVDVLFHPEWQDDWKIFHRGHFLNQQLLDAGLARYAVY